MHGAGNGDSRTSFVTISLRCDHVTTFPIFSPNGSIGAAIEVHRHLGPGLLEAIYEECLCLELADAGIEAVRQTLVPVVYKGRQLRAFYRADLIVANQVVVEIKSNEKLIEVHQAQVLTYLRVTGLHTGLLFNFNTAVLAKGIKRISL